MSLGGSIVHHGRWHDEQGLIPVEIQSILSAGLYYLYPSASEKTELWVSKTPPCRPDVLPMAGIVGAEISFEKGAAFFRGLGCQNLRGRMDRPRTRSGYAASLDTLSESRGTVILMWEKELSSRSGKHKDGSSRIREVNLCSGRSSGSDPADSFQFPRCSIQSPSNMINMKGPIEEFTDVCKSGKLGIFRGSIRFQIKGTHGCQNNSSQNYRGIEISWSSTA